MMKIKVLIVDDMSDIRYSVKVGLEGNDKRFEVHEACSGEDALRQLPQVHPDVILMDVMMPGIDGIDTTLMIKNNPSFKDIPVIILTAKTDKLTKGMSGVCAQAYLEKPFDIETLVKAIGDVVGESDRDD